MSLFESLYVLHRTDQIHRSATQQVLLTERHWRQIRDLLSRVGFPTAEKYIPTGHKAVTSQQMRDTVQNA